MAIDDDSSPGPLPGQAAAPAGADDPAFDSAPGAAGPVSRRQLFERAGIAAGAGAVSFLATPATAAPPVPASAASTAPMAGKVPVYRAVPQLGRLRDQVLFGDVWRQPELSPRDRSMVTVAVLAALGKADEMRSHLRRAVANGVTNDEIRGMVVQIAFYAGWPAAIGLAEAALPIIAPEEVKGR